MMPFKPPKRAVPDVENKLKLLYCVSALGQVTEVQLWPFVASLDLMEYIPMQLLLHELLSGGDLVRGEEALSGSVSLSLQGQETLRLFSQRILSSEREKIMQAAPLYRAEMEKRRQVQAVYELAKKDDYRVRLSLQEGELSTLLIRLQTHSQERAAYSLKYFEQNVASILIYLYGLQPPEEALAEGEGDILRHSASEHMVTGMLSGEEVSLEITLLLPTPESAAEYGRIFSREERKQEIAARLIQWLCPKEK